MVAEATDAETLLTQAEATQPDVIVLDRDMCDRPLEELIPALHRLDPQPRVVLLDSRPESEQAALAAGADAFVFKGPPPESLLIAIESVRLKREG